MASTKQVAVIPGDGIGHDVTAQALKVLEALRSSRGCGLEWEVLDLGADRYLRDGTTLPASTLQHIREGCNAVLLGALGDPRVPDQTHARDILFGLRFGLDLFCNLRPVRCVNDRLMPLKEKRAKDADFAVFRENTEGAYAGIGGWLKKDTPDEVAIGQDVNTRKGVERILRAAFAHAQGTGCRSIHMTDKSNAMPHAHGLWRRCFEEVAAEYPSLEASHMYVDALCLALVQDPAPFEVIVTCNLFGDIVSDLAAGLMGGLGMAPSANIHPGRVSMFEPVHGSAPALAGKDVANPLAMVSTVGMMMNHLGYPEEERLLAEIVAKAIETRHCTADVGGTLGTHAVGDWVVAEIHQQV